MLNHKSLVIPITSAAFLIFSFSTLRAASDCDVNSVTQPKCWFLGSNTEVQRGRSTLLVQASPPSAERGSIAKRPEKTATLNPNVGRAPRKQKNVGQVSSASKGRTEATHVAECEAQAVKVYDNEKKTFLKQCLSADTR